MSDTPRTNAHREAMEVEDFDVELAITYTHAETLERENAAMREAIEEAHDKIARSLEPDLGVSLILLHSAQSKTPRYTEPGRYPYHFVCTRIKPYNPDFLKRVLESDTKNLPWIKQGATHGCYCSAWKQQKDGTFLHWRDGRWQAPIRGSIKSKPIEP